MRCPHEWYQLHEAIRSAFPRLRPAQQRGLSWWVYGTLLAHSACQTAVLAVLIRLGAYHAWRQYLREWLYDGQERAAPCQTQLEVSACFAPLLAWLVRWWQEEQWSYPGFVDSSSLVGQDSSFQAATASWTTRSYSAGDR